jgi:hypothetical protein
MRKALFILPALLILAATLHGQTVERRAPDCVIGMTAKAAQVAPPPADPASGQVAGYKNTPGCIRWTLAYSSQGFTGVSIELDQAQDVGNTPGTFAAFPNTASGTQPLTSTTSGQITVYKYYPWVSINLSSVTGTGTVRAVAYGWTAGSGDDSSAAPGSSGGGGGGCASPCPVTQSTSPWIVAGAGTAGTPATGVESIQGVASGTPVPISSGSTLNVAGTGTAGAPGTAALTVQGISSGTPVPITGTVTTAANASVGATGSAVPASGTYAAGLNGGNLVGEAVDASGRQEMVGAAASGGSSTGVNPVLVGGLSGTTLEAFATDTSGRLIGSYAASVAPASVDITGYGAFGTPGTSNSRPLAVATLGTDPCLSSGYVKSSVFANISTATTTALVAVSGSTVVYVCAINAEINSTTASTILFEQGTGTACASSPVALTATYTNSTVAALPLKLESTGMVFATAASNGLCAVTTVGTGPTIPVTVTYVQK